MSLSSVSLSHLTLSTYASQYHRTKRCVCRYFCVMRLSLSRFKRNLSLSHTHILSLPHTHTLSPPHTYRGLLEASDEAVWRQVSSASHLAFVLHLSCLACRLLLSSVLHVCCMCVAGVLYVCCMCVACDLHVICMCVACDLRVCCMCVACVLHVYCMCVARVLHVCCSVICMTYQ